MLEIPTSWRPYLADEFDALYMQELQKFLQLEKPHNVIFPPEEHWLHALQATPLNKVKVVIIGQDPYHQQGQAHGLSFSVKPGVKIPPSLLNIYKELESDLAIPRANHGYLESWAKQGVLLLNAVLTVNDSCPASHQGKGWEQFTDKVIDVVNRECDHVVFLLWGSYAQKKGTVIDGTRHLVLEAPHPSPLAAYRGFFGCCHFSQANTYLLKEGRGQINWALPDISK